MGTRSELLLLLRRHPGIAVSELAGRLRVTPMAVRRHLGCLQGEALVEADPAPPETRKGAGRPPAGWRLSSAGLEIFPRCYDSLALDLLADVASEGGDDAVEALFHRQSARLAQEYAPRLDAVTDLADKVGMLAEIRDAAGYLAESEAAGDGSFVLTESNCAVHRVAQRYPAVCAMELQLLKGVMGRGVEVSRVSHTMAGDAVCSYRFRPCSGEDGSGENGSPSDCAASTPAAPA